MALINLRNALMAWKRLPYDNEIEFLESTGTQWVNTGVVSSGIDIKCLMAFTDNTVANQGVFGSRVNSGDTGSNAYQIWYNISSNNLRLDWASYTKTAAVSLDTPVRIEAYQNGSIFVNGTEYTGNAKTANACNFYIFNFNQGGALGATGCRAKVYSFQIWQNGVLVRDYIPVRKGAVGYLYDRVSGKLFGNAGTGDFVLGPDVVPVEYIESHGTEWIDTGVKGRDGYDFEYRFSPIGPLPLGIGGEYETDKNCYIGLVRSNGYLAYNYYYPNNIVEVQSLTLGTDYNVKAHLYSGEQYFEVNGVRGGVGSREGAFTSSYNLYLFAINTTNQPTAFGTMRLYNLTAHLNTIPTRSFRPVRVGTEGAMMDVLTRRIYRNAGTGAFTYGNDLKYPIPAE